MPPTRRRPWIVRAGVLLGGMAVTMTILWATGLASQDLWVKVFTHKPQRLAIRVPPRPAIPIVAPPLAPRGGDSSISTESLPLILVQTMPGRNAHEGTAQIGVVRETPQTYQAGAVLENGARLEEIYGDYVLLEKGGRSAKLYVQGRQMLGPPKLSPLLAVGGIKHPSPPPAITSREVLTDYIRPSPVYEADNVIGYRVYAGSIAGPFAQMGLQPGDLITSIAGMPLNDPATTWEMFRQIADGGVLSAVVRGQNSSRNVTLDGTLIVRAEESRSGKAQGAVLAAGSP